VRQSSPTEFHAGNVKFNAAGSIVTSPTLSWVGEAGPEVILPLNDKARSMALLAQSGLLRRDGPEGLPAPVASGAAAGGGDMHLTIPVVIDGREVGRATARYTQAELVNFKRNNVNAGLS
jgi:hypothetical protein